MKVIVISKECYNFIGVADTLEHAIDFLMDKDWLNEETTISIFNDKINYWEDVPVTERFGKYWGNTLRGAKNCDELNDAFCGLFFFEEVDIYTGED